MQSRSESPFVMYLSESEEEQLVLGVVDQSRKDELLTGVARPQALISSVGLADAAVVSYVLALCVDAVHL